MANSESMKNLGVIYQEAFDHTFENMMPERQVLIAKFWLDVVVGQKPYLSVTEEGVVKVTNEVFGNAVVLDFMLTLTSAFIIRWAASAAEREEVIDLIASGLSLQIGTKTAMGDYRAAPTAIATRLSSKDDILKLLTANPWLLVIVLAPYFTKYQDLVPEEADGGKPKRPSRKP